MEEDTKEFLYGLFVSISVLGLGIFIFYTAQDNQYKISNCLIPFAENYCKINNMTYFSSDNMGYYFYCINSSYNERLGINDRYVKFYYLDSEIKSC